MQVLDSRPEGQLLLKGDNQVVVLGESGDGLCVLGRKVVVGALLCQKQLAVASVTVNWSTRVQETVRELVRHDCDRLLRFVKLNFLFRFHLTFDHILNGLRNWLSFFCLCHCFLFSSHGNFPYLVKVDVERQPQCLSDSFVKRSRFISKNLASGYRYIRIRPQEVQQKQVLLAYGCAILDFKREQLIFVRKVARCRVNNLRMAE